MLVAQNSLGPVCPVPLTVRGSRRDQGHGHRVAGPIAATGGGRASAGVGTVRALARVRVRGRHARASSGSVLAHYWLRGAGGRAVDA